MRALLVLAFVAALAGCGPKKAPAVTPVAAPSLAARADERLRAGDDEGALKALEALVAAEPGNADARTRLDLVRLRIAQAEMTAADQAKAAGKFDEAAAHLARALDVTPQNTAALVAWSALELAQGHADAAEAKARQALDIDPADPAAKAAADNAAAARMEASMPDWYRALPSAATVTRGQVAALLGAKLSKVLASTPTRRTTVLTDVQGSWAEPFILSVVKAGWIEPQPNHTFQPNATIRRSELAWIVATALSDVAAGHPRDLASWRDAKPAIADVPRSHAAYSAVAIAVASGVLQVQNGRFGPSRPVTGAELMAAVSRMEQAAR